MTSHVSTHILDTSTGRPARGLAVTLSTAFGDVVAHATTDADGRVSSLGPPILTPGEYELSFAVSTYFEKQNVATFFPRVSIIFAVDAGIGHYHVPLLLSPFAYTVYRGS